MTPPTRSPDILAAAQAGRVVVQDFTPLAAGLEWDLGARYLAARGSSAFLSDPVPVPHAVTNAGGLARRAADVLLAALDAAAAAGTLPAEVRVLELGPGLGLFARHLLDAVRAHAAATGRDH